MILAPSSTGTSHEVRLRKVRILETLGRFRKNPQRKAAVLPLSCVYQDDGGTAGEVWEMTHLLDRLTWATQAARMALGEKKMRPSEKLRPIEEQKLDELIGLCMELKEQK